MIYIGHRGCNYEGYNQNTIRSFEKVINQSCKAFEFDVQLSSDNKLVVVHNLDLTKVSNGKGLVRNTSLENLRKLKAGNVNNDKIPTLKEVLDLVVLYPDVTMHLELKGDDTGIVAAKEIKPYLDRGELKPSNFLVSSFNWDELKLFKTIVPNIDIALLEGAIRRKHLLKLLPGCEELCGKIFAYGNEDYMLPKTTNIKDIIEELNTYENDDSVKDIIIKSVKECLQGKSYNDDLINEALYLNAYSINLWYKTINQNIIKKAHANNIKVFAYTINTHQEISKLKELGVDGVFTDYYINMIN